MLLSPWLEITICSFVPAVKVLAHCASLCIGHTNEFVYAEGSVQHGADNVWLFCSFVFIQYERLVLVHATVWHSQRLSRYDSIYQSMPFAPPRPRTHTSEIKVISNLESHKDFLLFLALPPQPTVSSTIPAPALTALEQQKSTGRPGPALMGSKSSHISTSD